MSVRKEETSTTATAMSGKIVERLGDIVVAGVETTSQFSIGQGLLKAADRFLWVVEKSAQWSLPVHEVTAEENGKAFGKIELVRPLPWIFFLPSLVMLRALRLGVNIGAVILGYSKLEIIGLVKIVQKGRRKLRSIKSNGLKNIRCRKSSRNREEELNEAKKSLINSMLSTLSALSCIETSRRTPSPPPTRVYVKRSEPDAVSKASPQQSVSTFRDCSTTTTQGEESPTESACSPQINGKRKYSEVENIQDDSSELSEDESVRAKLDRLAAEDSDTEDRDFDPVKEELTMNTESNGSSGEEGGEDDDDEDDDDDDDDDDENDDDYLSDTEVEDLRRACLETTNIAAAAAAAAAASAVVDDVIVEEPEPEVEPTSTPKQEENGIEDCENSEEDPATSTPRTPIEKDDENMVKYYSPINSPGVDSPAVFNSSEENDLDLDLDHDQSKQPTSPSAPSINDKASNDTGDKKNSSSSQIKETQIDNENSEKQAIVSPTISGSSTDGIPATINKNSNTDNKINKNNNGCTEDEKRIIPDPNTNVAKTKEK